MSIRLNREIIKRVIRQSIIPIVITSIALAVGQYYANVYIGVYAGEAIQIAVVRVFFNFLSNLGMLVTGGAFVFLAFNETLLADENSSHSKEV